MKRICLFPVAYTLIAILFFVLLIPGLGESFIQTNGIDWVERSERFYQALEKGDFSSTYQKYHPGVTVMWALGFLIRVFGKYQDIFLNMRSPLLEYGTYSGFAFFARLSLGAFFFINLLIFLKKLETVTKDKLFVLLVGFFIATEPFIVVFNRVFTPDAFLFIFILNSIIFFTSFLKGKRSSDLVISGIYTGFALLTKVTAIILFPTFILIPFLFYGKEIKKTLLKSLKSAVVLIGISGATFFALFPAMWVSPIKTLHDVIFLGLLDAPLNDFASPIVEASLSKSSFISTFLAYPLVFIFRSSPMLLIFMFVGLALFLKRKEKRKDILMGFIIFGILYYIPVSFSKKKIYKYTLMFFVTAIPLASYGASFLMRRHRTAKYVIAFLLVSQLYFVIKVVPNYLLYFNPILGGSGAAVRVVDFKVETTGYPAVAKYINAQGSDEDTIVGAYLPKSLGPFTKARVEDIRESLNPDYILVPKHAKKEFSRLLDKCYRTDLILNFEGIDYLFLYRNVCN